MHFALKITTVTESARILSLIIYITCSYVFTRCPWKSYIVLLHWCMGLGLGLFPVFHLGWKCFVCSPPGLPSCSGWCRQKRRQWDSCGLRLSLVWFNCLHFSWCTMKSHAALASSSYCLRCAPGWTNNNHRQYRLKCPAVVIRRQKRAWYVMVSRPVCSGWQSKCADSTGFFLPVWSISWWTVFCELIRDGPFR